MTCVICHNEASAAVGDVCLCDHCRAQVEETQELLVSLEDKARHAKPVSQLRGEADGAAFVGGRSYRVQGGQLYGPEEANH